MIICAGEALIDMVENPEQREMCFVPKPGGSPYNTALAAARAGADVGFFGTLSVDGFGRKLMSRLNDEHVSVKYVKQCTDPTALAFVQIREHGEPEYSFYFNGTSMTAFDSEKSAQLINELHVISCVVFGSISLVVEPTATLLEAMVLSVAASPNRCIISYDPNVRPALIRDKAIFLERFQKIVEHADIVKVSQADLEYVMPGVNFETALQQLAKQGPVLVVGTRGSRGALCIRRNADGALLQSEVSGRTVTVADTVGAGDTFHGALLAALQAMGKLNKDALRTLNEEQFKHALEFAVSASALVCMRYGAEPPTLQEINAMLPQ